VAGQDLNLPGGTIIRLQLVAHETVARFGAAVAR
jgi:hypothetical protein